MLFSLGVAFVVSPWAAMRLLFRSHAEKQKANHAEGGTTRLYRRIMSPLIRSKRHRYGFLVAVVVLLLAAAAFVPLKLVRVKMLPFDNKSEFQVIVDMPDGTPLEQTTRISQTLGRYLAQQPEVANYQIYAGTSGPINFNGLVRHYYMRQQPNHADIQVNLKPASERRAQSHEIAKRVRPALDSLALPFGARIKVREVPPGPPVVQTLVAEIYGPQFEGQIDVARKVKQIFAQTPGVVDVDWYVEDPQQTVNLRVDEEKAALDGIAVSDVTKALQTLESGAQAGLLHDSTAREPIPITLRLNRADRSSIDSL